MELVKQTIQVASLRVESEPIIICHETSLHNAILASGRIMLPIPGGYQCCLPDDILYLKAESNYTEIFYKDGSKKLLSNTLKVLEDILPSHRFFRTHKSYVVNAAHITDIVLSTQEKAVKLIGGIKIPICKRKISMFNNKSRNL